MKRKPTASLVGALACALFLISGIATAQVGPDVIVGAITGPSNYSHVGGIDAFSVGTTSCNIGDQDLPWISNTNQHPVIGQNAFRIWNGRFEQIGQSWLKHGFFALSQTLCGSCPNPTNGTALGVGCSDPYGSGLNGSQGGLGNKFEVNASTGFFNYPYAEGNQGSTGNSIYKRLQIHLSDLDPANFPGAVYVVEAQYIQPQDAMADNDNNNASWMSCSFSPSGGGYNMSLQGGTHQQEPAIFAWQAMDPSVSLIPVDVPGDGRFWAGFKVTDQGNGTFHWEVAVHNLNSHLSARAFSIDFPAGATVSNVGFHDVDYHSGEPFDGTDWTSSITGNTITWSTQTFAQNQNANALRWGTTYNFRFDTNQGPPSGTVTASLELFRPTANPVVNFAFTPPNTMVVVSGDNQIVNINETFQPCTVRVQTAGGAPVAGVPVTFNITSGSGTIITPTMVNSDANGLASATVMAPAVGGAVVLETSTPTDVASFNLFARQFRVTWIPTPGVLVFSAQGGVANMPLTMAFDNSSTPVLTTPFGNLYTSILNPGPDFGAISAYAGVGSFDPTVMTGPTGTWTRAVTGAGALAGSGLDLVFQVYGYFIDSTGGHYWLSNPVYQIF